MLSICRASSQGVIYMYLFRKKIVRETYFNFKSILLDLIANRRSQQLICNLFIKKLESFNIEDKYVAKLLQDIFKI